jgi:Ras family
VTSEQGQELARKLGFLYRETSAINDQGITECVQDLTE